jgi:hypothetical protein
MIVDAALPGGVELPGTSMPVSAFALQGDSSQPYGWSA